MATPRNGAGSLLSYAWTGGPFTTGDAVTATGFTRATVIAQAEELIAHGWLDALPDTRTAGDGYRAGRPARRFAFRPERNLVVGVDAGAGRLTAVLTDLAGREIARETSTLPREDPSPADRRDAVRTLVEAVRGRAPRGGGPLAAICIGVPAPIGMAGLLRGRNPFWDLMEPGLEDALSSLDVPVVLDNDANLAALAESQMGAAAGYRSSATLLSGERFGTGLILDGRIVRGARGDAGELQILDMVEGVGDSYGIAASVRRWAAEDVRTGRVPDSGALAGIDPSDLEAETVFLAAGDGDAYAQSLMDRSAERLARICRLLGGLLGVETVVVAGAIAPSLDPVIDRAHDVLARMPLSPPMRIAASPLVTDAVALGASLRAIDAVREAAMSGPGGS
ncbi:MAG: ROK family protein [Brachybacterium sp.]|nr:ROK family protein [Brachybacterium sp.]